MKKISVYVKGNRNAPTYYRIYQYFDNIKDCQFTYRQMYSDIVHDSFMPLSKQPIYIKVFAMLHAYLRVLRYLIKDWIITPDVVVIHRRVLVRYMPKSYKLLLNSISKRAKIIWDFDDNIIENKEVNNDTLSFYAQISSNINVTHNFLKDLVPKQYQNKVIILPTTDGDMYKDYIKHPEIQTARLKSLNDRLELVWVATSVNLPFLQNIAPELDKVATLLKNKYSKRLILNVVCNKPLDFKAQYLTINNIEWTRERAISSIYTSHVGIMPLIENEFTKGKGGFKLVQYMSAGLPCIASNVGFNASVISEDMGYLVSSNTEWIDAIVNLSNVSIWKESSKAAYTKWEEKFSFHGNLDIWKSLLQIF